MSEVVEGGSILRIKCDYQCFLSPTPYDGRCDQSKRGTAFLLQLNGTPVIVTAHHVVSNAVSVMATSPSLGDGEARALRIIGYNPYLDIAILLGPDDIMNLTPFVPQQSSNMKPKHAVTCVGFAAGTLRTHTTSGTVSGRNDFPHNRIQTDTAVNPGNSGGPVIDASTKHVIGVVTSGMTGMQTTNFFTPMDEAWQSIRRIITRYRAHGHVGIDMGYHLNAVVRSVNAAACHGQRGGAHVAAASADIGLEEGDVILAMETPERTMVDINAHMRVNVPSIWAYDAVDFRSVFDALTHLETETSIRMLVRRANVERVVQVKLGRMAMASRELFPDCEPVAYVAYGGLVVQTLGISHAFNVTGISESTFTKPDMAMSSKPAITHVTAGSPFATHGAAELVGCIVTKMEGANGDVRDVKTLKDVEIAIREIKPLVLVLHDGTRVGASREDLDAYDAKQGDESLREGRHTVVRGPLSRASETERTRPSELPPSISMATGDAVPDEYGTPSEISLLRNDNDPTAP